MPYALRTLRREHAISKLVTLTVIEDVPAGKMPTKSVGKGANDQNHDGAPYSAGADTVIKVEDTEHTPDSVRVFKGNCAAQHPAAGEDVQKGDWIIPKGKSRFDPAKRVCWLFSRSPGCWSISVRASPSCRRAMNSPILTNASAKKNHQFEQLRHCAAVHEAGGVPILLGIARDTPRL